MNRAKILAEILVKRFNYIEIENKSEENAEKNYNLNDRIDYSGTKT